jgi:predicted  nucleic acid-binding Zn-ribbon protein
MEDLKTALLTLQDLDNEIAQARTRLKEFEPRLAEVDQPIAAIERELETTRTRLDELRREVKRLESAATQKRETLKKYEERLTRVRNVREQSAARAEMDLVRRAADADDTEAIELMEQATRTDLRLDDLQKNLDKLRAETAPRREELLSMKSEAESQMAVLLDQRQNHAIRLEGNALRLYERVRRGRAAMVVAPLTDEGACGHCFNILPVQEQAEIRRGDTLRRCEACGVILYVG